MSISHCCHFPGCKTPTPRKRLYCKPHWFMVPTAIRRRVWLAYNALPHGPEGNCLRISREWIAAVGAAEAAIKQQLKIPSPSTGEGKGEGEHAQAQTKKQTSLLLPGV